MMQVRFGGQRNLRFRREIDREESMQLPAELLPPQRLFQALSSASNSEFHRPLRPQTRGTSEPRAAAMLATRTTRRPALSRPNVQAARRRSGSEPPYCGPLQRASQFAVFMHLGGACHAQSGKSVFESGPAP